MPVRSTTDPVAKRKSFLLRLDPLVHEALERWAKDELRSVNAQVEYLLREALSRAGRSPRRGSEEEGASSGGPRDPAPPGPGGA